MNRSLTALLLTLVVVQGVRAQDNGRPINRLGRAVNAPGMRGAGVAGIHEAFTPPVTAAKIRTAIDDAVLYLRSQQTKEGNIGDEGTTALATLTLLAAGGDPAADDGLKKALDWLAKHKPDNTYIRGVRANVWEYALRKLPDEKVF